MGLILEPFVKQPEGFVKMTYNQQPNLTQIRDEIINSLKPKYREKYESLINSIVHIDSKWTDEGWRIQGWLRIDTFVTLFPTGEETMTFNFDKVNLMVQIYIWVIDKAKTTKE